jgi:quinol monooxygenase YgiN
MIVKYSAGDRRSSTQSPPFDRGASLRRTKMNTIHVVARFRIKDGNLAEFKRIGVLALATAYEKEPNTEQYDWFLDADQSTCVVMQRYVNFAAFVHHIENFSETRLQLLAICDLSIEVYGDLQANEIAFLAAYQIKTFQWFQSLAR